VAGGSRTSARSADRRGRGCVPAQEHEGAQAGLVWPVRVVRSVRIRSRASGDPADRRRQGWRLETLVQDEYSAGRRPVRRSSGPAEGRVTEMAKAVGGERALECVMGDQRMQVA